MASSHNHTRKVGHPFRLFHKFLKLIMATYYYFCKKLSLSIFFFDCHNQTSLLHYCANINYFMEMTICVSDSTNIRKHRDQVFVQNRAGSLDHVCCHCQYYCQCYCIFYCQCYCNYITFYFHRRNIIYRTNKLYLNNLTNV